MPAHLADTWVLLSSPQPSTHQWGFPHCGQPLHLLPSALSTSFGACTVSSWDDVPGLSTCFYVPYFYLILVSSHLAVRFFYIYIKSYVLILHLDWRILSLSPHCLPEICFYSQESSHWCIVSPSFELFVISLLLLGLPSYSVYVPCIANTYTPYCSHTLSPWTFWTFGTLFWYSYFFYMFGWYLAPFLLFSYGLFQAGGKLTTLWKSICIGLLLKGQYSSSWQVFRARYCIFKKMAR